MHLLKYKTRIVFSAYYCVFVFSIFPAFPSHWFTDCKCAHILHNLWQVRVSIGIWTYCRHILHSRTLWCKCTAQRFALYSYSYSYLSRICTRTRILYTSICLAYSYIAIVECWCHAVFALWYTYVIDRVKKLCTKPAKIGGGSAVPCPPSRQRTPWRFCSHYTSILVYSFLGIRVCFPGNACRRKVFGAILAICSDVVSGSVFSSILSKGFDCNTY